MCVTTIVKSQPMQVKKASVVALRQLTTEPRKWKLRQQSACVKSMVKKLQKNGLTGYTYIQALIKV